MPLQHKQVRLLDAKRKLVAVVTVPTEEVGRVVLTWQGRTFVRHLYQIMSTAAREPTRWGEDYEEVEPVLDVVAIPGVAKNDGSAKEMPDPETQAAE